MMNNEPMSYEETYGHDYEPTSEEFYADQAPADWANEDPKPDQPKGQCEDAPCCGCCGPTNDEVANTYAADAWHDAHEYPEW